jgi:hypothetical protein
MSRQVFLMGLGLTLVALALVLTDTLIAPAPGLTPQNVRRLRRGMTEVEVEALFGRDADRHLGHGECAFVAAWQATGRPAECKLWRAERGGVYVGFGDDGRVTGHLVYGDLTEVPGPLDRLRAWLGW